MGKPTMHVRPGRSCGHSRVRLTLDLRRVLTPEEMAGLASALHRWTGRAVHVVLHAGTNLRWLEEWSEGLDGAAMGEVEQVEIHTTLAGTDSRDGLPF